MNEINKTGRVGIIDEIRGLSIILMVIYHLVYDLVAIFGIYFPLFFSAPINILRDIFAGVFIAISGVSCNYSKNNLKRGIICLGLGFFLSLITFIFMPKEAIRFGILHMLGISMILYSLLKRFIFNTDKPYIGIIICVIMFILTLNIGRGYVGFIQLPDVLYTKAYLFPFGITSPAFFSADYFPLLPWTFLFLAGSYFGIYFKRGKLPKVVYQTHFKPLAVAGQHTLIIYLLHQPVIFILLQTIFYFIKG